MVDNNKEFIVGKKNALESLKKAGDMKKVDKEILPILNLINSSTHYYTSSSCAGRIVLLEIPRIGDKKSAFFLGKWHRAINLEEVNIAVKKAKLGFIWLLAQAPIFHIIADTNATADTIVKAAIACGFKNSGLKSLAKRIIVEICSTERLDAPIGRDGHLLCNEEHLVLLVDIANDVFMKSKEKLSRFETFLQEKKHF